MAVVVAELQRQELMDAARAREAALNRLDNVRTEDELVTAELDLQAAEMRFRVAYRRATGR